MESPSGKNIFLLVWAGRGQGGWFVGGEAEIKKKGERIFVFPGMLPPYLSTLLYSSISFTFGIYIYSYMKALWCVERCCFLILLL